MPVRKIEEQRAIVHLDDKGSLIVDIVNDCLHIVNKPALNLQSNSTVPLHVGQESKWFDSLHNLVSVTSM